VKPVPFEKFKGDWLLQLAADSKLTLSALKIAIAISSHMNRKRGGLPRSKKIKVLRWSGTTDFSRSSLGFLPTVSHQRLTARPMVAASLNALQKPRPFSPTCGGGTGKVSPGASVRTPKHVSLGREVTDAR
jgi:hypothetical protein